MSLVILLLIAQVPLPVLPALPEPVEFVDHIVDANKMLRSPDCDCKECLCVVCECGATIRKSRIVQPNTGAVVSIPTPSLAASAAPAKSPVVAVHGVVSGAPRAAAKPGTAVTGRWRLFGRWKR